MHMRPRDGNVIENVMNTSLDKNFACAEGCGEGVSFLTAQWFPVTCYIYRPVGARGAAPAMPGPAELRTNEGPA